MTKFNVRAREAAKRFLVSEGYEILQTPWLTPDGKDKFDIVAQHQNELVFVDVYARKAGTEFPVERKSRKRSEALAIQYLANTDQDVVGKRIRFDAIALVAVGDSSAMIRHHVNRLGGALAEAAATS